jgi:hypothetical protein
MNIFDKISVLIIIAISICAPSAIYITILSQKKSIIYKTVFTNRQFYRPQYSKPFFLKRTQKSKSSLLYSLTTTLINNISPTELRRVTKRKRDGKFYIKISYVFEPFII